MALARRFLLIGDCYLNNQFIEKGNVILWDPDKANNAMVPCDAKGRPLERHEAVEDEPVQVIAVAQPEPQPEKIVPEGEARAALIAVAVKDVLDRDDDSDWTKQGEIRIDVIRKATNIEDVTRDEIKEAVDAINEDEAEAAETEGAKGRAAAKED